MDNGTTQLFAAFNTADGTVISSLHRRHRSTEFKKLLAKIDQEVPADLDVHAICTDTYSTHKESRRENMAGGSPPGSRCTSLQRIPAGSTRWSGCSRSFHPKTSCNTAITTASSNWKQTSTADWASTPFTAHANFVRETYQKSSSRP